MTDHLTDEAVKALLDGATPGPWRADGEPWNRVVWSSAENRVCFMSHSNGLDDARDIATSELVASAPNLARTVIALHAELAQARADAKAAVAVVVERAAERLDLAEHDAEERDWRSGANAFTALAKAIRALAPEDAMAEVAKLRAERDDAVADCTMARSGREIAISDRDRLAAELSASRAREAGLRGAVEALCAVLDRNDKKGPIPDVEMMFCWLAAQGVRAAFRSDGLSYMQKGKTT